MTEQTLFSKDGYLPRVPRLYKLWHTYILLVLIQQLCTYVPSWKLNSYGRLIEGNKSSSKKKLSKLDQWRQPHSKTRPVTSATSLGRKRKSFFVHVNQSPSFVRIQHGFDMISKWPRILPNKETALFLLNEPRYPSALVNPPLKTLIFLIPLNTSEDTAPQTFKWRPTPASRVARFL
jgi:hypothetical protein